MSHTSKLARLRPRPAVVASLAVLTVAAGGIAAADGPDSSLQALKKSKVRKIAANQANKAITQRAPTLEVLLAQSVADNAITTAKIADGAVTSAKLAEEAVKARELGPTQIVTNGAGLANNATGTVAVNCPAGSQMVSGGGTTTLGGNDLVLVLRSFPSTNGWVVTYRNISTVAVTITAVATCLSA